MPAPGSEAASSKVRPAGLGVASEAGALMRSAIVPLAARMGSSMPATASPGAKPVTPGPTASTTPE